MSQPWIKLWKNDLLSSLNYQTLSISEKGIYNTLLLLCRDEDYAGQFCWPNGNPLSISEIIMAMGPKEHDRTDRIKVAIDNMIRKGLLFKNKRECIEIRKYAQKTGQTAEQLRDSCQPVPDQSKKKQAQKNTSLHTEEESDTDADIDNNIAASTEAALITPKPKREYPTPGRSEKEYDAPDLIGYFGKRFKAVTEYTYPANFGKDGKIFKDLLPLYEPLLILDLIDLFFEMAQKDESWVRDKLSIGVFKTQLPNLLIKKREEKRQENRVIV
ncbi:MAG: hypothetical protein QME51_10935 [Planctomycetota bacterium]|nr:hypothetical protein [Planctomycetota bacterium]